ncbi:MAG TPA: hypothetical protein VHO06_18915 [Polyangia bacterium]|nr:hypothetical protein [Polyangia bacterium]
MADPKSSQEVAEPGGSAAPTKKRRSKRRRKGTSGQDGGAGANRFAPRPFPKDTLERALKIPAAIKEKNGGNPWPPEDVAGAVGLSRGAPAFYYLTASARDYGLTDGARDSKKIGLAPLGKSLVYPQSEREEAAARLEAFRKIKPFADVLAHYGGNRLPELQYVKNTLKREFDLDERYHEEFVELFKANCEFIGIKEGQALGTAGVGERRKAGTTARAAVDGAVTVAEPDEASSLTCFVIMPFTERDNSRPANFFSEVLTRLITPACVSAGFRVVTADRRGSDVIHSTIVNSLLDADLVVADMTDHNPNVLFELGMRMHADKPIALIQAEGTTRIFDVDNVLRVLSYNPNLWTSTLEADRPKLTEHVKAAWEHRESLETYMKLLRRKDSAPGR